MGGWYCVRRAIAVAGHRPPARVFWGENICHRVSYHKGLGREECVCTLSRCHLEHAHQRRWGALWLLLGDLLLWYPCCCRAGRLAIPSCHALPHSPLECTVATISVLPSSVSVRTDPALWDAPRATHAPFSFVNDTEQSWVSMLLLLSACCTRSHSSFGGRYSRSSTNTTRSPVSGFLLPTDDHDLVDLLLTLNISWSTSQNSAFVPFVLELCPKSFSAGSTGGLPRCRP